MWRPTSPLLQLLRIKPRTKNTGLCLLWTARGEIDDLMGIIDLWADSFRWNLLVLMIYRWFTFTYRCSWLNRLTYTAVRHFDTFRYISIVLVPSVLMLFNSGGREIFSGMKFGHFETPKHQCLVFIKLAVHDQLFAQSSTSSNKKPGIVGCWLTADLVSKNRAKKGGVIRWIASPCFTKSLGQWVSTLAQVLWVWRFH